jgi:hypothetical protein
MAIGRYILRGTFSPDDVTLLLKDITGTISPMATTEREKLIQSGIHYSEMLPLEYVPSPQYINAFEAALDSFSDITAEAVAHVSEKIYRTKGSKAVLVSLARSGTPIGILIKRYILNKYNINVPHYSISIIRGKGIDANAMRYILRQHAPDSVQFVDGWTGKGAILRTLQAALSGFPNVSPELAVVADPPRLTDIYGTREDFLIASACLNSTVCGLMSRTVLRSDLIGENDFHGVVFYDELKNEDRTYTFIDKVTSCFKYELPETEQNPPLVIDSMEEIRHIAEQFGVGDINFVKPSIGETTRVLLRRVPDVILIRKNADMRYLSHLIALAAERGVPVEEYPLVNYNACGIIRSVGDI